MTTKTDASHPCGCGEPGQSERDRYVSFVGLDCDGQAKRLIALLGPYMDDPAKGNAFWTLFAHKLNPASGPKHDALFLIHAHINILRDQLEAHQDEAALSLLDQIEQECC
jgi:hypothetical protein